MRGLPVALSTIFNWAFRATATVLVGANAIWIAQVPLVPSCAPEQFSERITNSEALEPSRLALNTSSGTVKPLWIVTFCGVPVVPEMVSGKIRLLGSKTTNEPDARTFSTSVPPGPLLCGSATM